MATEPTTHERETEFVRQLERLLAPSGWSRREVSEFLLAGFTNDVGGGVLAVADIAREQVSLLPRRGDSLQVRCGVGYQPAVDLMPVLSLEPDPMLLGNDDDSGREAFTLSPRRDALVATVERVATSVDGVLPFAAGFGDARAIYAAMLAADRREVQEQELRHRAGNQAANHDAAAMPADPTEDSANDGDLDTLVTYAVDIRKRLVMLASMRALEELRALLDANANAPERGQLARNRPRFDRQLRRWLDGGAPLAPPLAETMARLPRRRRVEMVSWSASLAQSRARQAAKHAAAAAADSDDPAEIAALLSAENERRGLVNSPFELAVGAKVIREERRPLGRFRAVASVSKTLASMVSDFARQARHDVPDATDWMEPPQRASYEVPSARSATAVRLDPAARDVVERTFGGGGGGGRAGRFRSVRVWLTRDRSDATSALAFIGDIPVGQLPLSTAFDQALRAAEFYDEDPILRGALWRLDETAPVALQVSDPDYE